MINDVRALRAPGALEAAQLATLIRRATTTEAGVPHTVLPPGAEPYFRVWRLVAPRSCPVPSGFGVLLVTDGAGRLNGPGTTIDVEPGVAVVVPAAARCSLDGDVGAYLAQPPAPDAPKAREWDT